MSTIPSRFRHSILIGGAVLVLSGCVTPWLGVPPTSMLAMPARIVATGHGSSGNYSQYASGQQRLMATRAAQIDAYRNLAERVHGFGITGATTVSSFATQSDTVRSYVDAFIRGARVVGVTASPDGNYEMTVELDITPQFIACMQTPSNCTAPVPAPGSEAAIAPAPAAACSAAGCGAGSSAFVSN